MDYQTFFTHYEAFMKKLSENMASLSPSDNFRLSSLQKLPQVYGDLLAIADALSNVDNKDEHLDYMLFILNQIILLFAQVDED